MVASRSGSQSERFRSLGVCVCSRVYVYVYVYDGKIFEGFVREKTGWEHQIQPEGGARFWGPGEARGPEAWKVEHGCGVINAVVIVVQVALDICRWPGAYIRVSNWVPAVDWS